MNTETIVVDIDDTVANLKEAFCYLIYHHTGVWKHWSEWETVIFSQVYPEIKEQFDWAEAIIRDKVLESLPPNDPDWPEVLQFAHTNFDVLVLSSRGYHPKGKEVTEAWLDKHNIPYDRVVMIHGHDKISKLDELGITPTLFIDDNPQILEACEKRFPGVAVRMDHAHNRHVATKHVAYSSIDVLTILKELL